MWLLLVIGFVVHRFINSIIDTVDEIPDPHIVPLTKFESHSDMFPCSPRETAVIEILESTMSLGSVNFLPNSSDVQIQNFRYMVQAKAWTPAKIDHGRVCSMLGIRGLAAGESYTLAIAHLAADQRAR